MPEHPNRVLACRQRHLASHGRRGLRQALHHCVTQPTEAPFLRHRLASGLMKGGSRRLKAGLFGGRKTEGRRYLAGEAGEVEQCADIDAIRVVLDDVISPTTDLNSATNSVRTVLTCPRTPLRTLGCTDQ